MTERILKQYGKRDLERVVEHATRKQWAAEQAYRGLRRRVWTVVAAVGAAAFGAGAGLGAWWAALR